MGKVTIAISTTRAINIPLVALIESAARKEHAAWGSTEIHIDKKDPSLPLVEQIFRTGKFASLHWTTGDKQLYSEANYVILAAPKSKLERKLNLLKKTGVKRFKTYSIP